MILDRIENLHLYKSVNKNIVSVLAFLGNLDLKTLKSGRNEIHGKEVFVLFNEYETKSKEQTQWEAHRAYIDVQYMLEGIEQIGYADINQLGISQEYDQSKDAVFLKGEGDSITLREGYFCIFNPNDAHRPSIAIKNPIPVKKLVFKVHV